MATSSGSSEPATSDFSAAEVENREGTVGDIVRNETTTLANEAAPAPTTNSGITLPPGDTPIGAAGGGGLGTTGTTATNTPPPTTTTTTTTSSGGGGGGSTDIGTGIGGTGVGLTPDQIAAALNGYLTSDNVGIETFIAMTGAPQSAEDGWNYFASTYQDTFTDLESSHDAIASAGFGVETDVSVSEVAAGTTLDIVSLDVIVPAVAALLLTNIGAWVAAHAAEGFPNPSVFGWRPLNFILEGINHLANELQTISQDMINSIVNLFTQPVRQLLGLFQRGTNAHAAAQNQNARVVQDTVPTAKQDAITAAEAYTDNAIAGVNNAANQALTMLTPPPTLAQAKQIITEAGQYDSLTWKFEAIGAAAIVSADEYADTLHDESTTAIAAAQTKAESDAQAAIASLQTQLVTRLSGDETSLSALATSVNTTLPLEIETAMNDAEATENQKLTAATSAIEQQITAIQAQISTLNTQIASANQAITTADNTITALQGETTVDEGAIAQEQAKITAANTEIATSTTAISDLYTQMTSISATLAPIQATQALQTSQISNITTDVEIALPTLLATLSATINSVKTEVDTCSVNTCDPTSPNYLKNALLALLGLLTDAAEIGFIAEAVNDPVGVANTLAPLLDSIGAGAIDTLDALLSL